MIFDIFITIFFNILFFINIFSIFYIILHLLGDILLLFFYQDFLYFIFYYYILYLKKKNYHFFLYFTRIYMYIVEGLSRVARFYATTEQNLIHSFWNALRIRRKINQLHQSSCYTSSIYYTTQNNPWIYRYRFNGKVFLIFFCITPHTRKIK